MSQLSLLDKYDEDTGGDKPRTIYKISESGRITVDTCRLPHMKGLLGSIEDLFGLVDNNKDKDKTRNILLFPLLEDQYRNLLSNLPS